MRLDERDLFGAGALALGLGLLLWKGRQLGQVVVDVFDRGEKLTSTTAPGGIVPDDPFDLLDDASAVLGRDANLDVYSLARMGRSEGVDGMEYRMHVALNDLADLQAHYGSGVYSSLTALMIHSKNADADGHYSEQGLGKRYATTTDPYEGDYHLAERVFSDRARGIDIAEGAIKFADKDSFGGVQKGTRSYEDVLAEWRASGLQDFSPSGASSNFVLFRRRA